MRVAARREPETGSPVFPDDVDTRRGILLRGSLILGLEAASASPGFAATEPSNGLYGLSAPMYGEDVQLSKYDGLVTVVVNVASE